MGGGGARGKSSLYTVFVCCFLSGSLVGLACGMRWGWGGRGWGYVVWEVLSG